MGFFGTIGGVLRGAGRIATAIIPGTLDNELFDAATGLFDRPAADPPAAVLRVVPGVLGSGGCNPGMIRDQSGICVSPGSPGDLSTGVSVGTVAGAPAIPQPSLSTVSVLKCPRFADGNVGILWMMPLTGAVVCLPRGVSGGKWGLRRKNKPRRKAFISAAEKKALDIPAATRKKAKEFAKLAGFKCSTK